MQKKKQSKLGIRTAIYFAKKGTNNIYVKIYKKINNNYDSFKYQFSFLHL